MDKQVYYNGSILTMENPSYVEALYVRNGVIEKVGTAREMLKYKHPDTQMIDLEGKTLMPSFIDAHGHLTTFAKSLMPNADLPLKGRDMMKWICSAQNIYLSLGITTALEGLIGQSEWEILKYAADKKQLALDIIGYVDFNETKSLLKKYTRYTKNFVHGLKLGGYKIFLDGYLSKQTAYLTSENYPSGSLSIQSTFYTDEELISLLKTVEVEGRQLIIHCNGDAAIDQLIHSYYTTFEYSTDTRPVIIHAEAIRPDQLERLKRIGLMPCYAIGNLYYEGDFYLQSLGTKETGKLCPLRTTTDKKIPFTLHQPSPPMMPNLLHAIWCATNRTTQSGHLLGEQEKLLPLDALRAVTLFAAYQCFEEEKKGSLRAGKLADLVILDQNPLTVPTQEIKNIKVLQTIKTGKVVYTSPGFSL